MKYVTLLAEVIRMKMEEDGFPYTNAPRPLSLFYARARRGMDDTRRCV